MSDANQEQPEAGNQLVSKAETLRVLREVMQRLEGIVNKLDAASPEEIPPTAAFDRLTASIETLETALEGVEVPENVKAAEVASAEEEAVDLGVIDHLFPSFDRLQAGWDWVLDRVRAVLPTSINEKLSDWAITGILTGLVVAVLTTAVMLVPSPSEPIPQPVAVVETPPLEIPPTPEVPPEPENIPPGLEPPAAVEVPAEPEEIPLEIEPPAAIEIPTEPEEITPEIDVPLEVAAPAEPEPIVIEPPPEPQLTPEQTLIATIQNRVAEITSQYADGLIHSIEADFLGSRLVVAIAPGWYDLTATRQDKIAQEMWQRSQALDFRKLEMTDLEGHLLARSPVVGKEMVIFARSRFAE